VTLWEKYEGAHHGVVRNLLDEAFPLRLSNVEVEAGGQVKEEDEQKYRSHPPLSSIQVLYTLTPLKHSRSNM
jgi:hypothetical protein